MGIDMNVWTVDEDIDIRLALRKGVNMLIGDRTDRAIEIRSQFADSRRDSGGTEAPV